MGFYFRSGTYFAPLLSPCFRQAQAMSIKTLEGLARRKCRHTRRCLRGADYNAAEECDELCWDELQMGTTYFLVVIAYDTAGNESKRSREGSQAFS